MRHGAGQQIALNDGVDDTLALGLGRGDVATGDDGVERILGASEPRQALRAAGPGQDTEMHFGKADARARDGDAIVRAERRLQPAAERCAVQGRDDDLGAVLHAGDHIVQAGT